MSWPGPVGGNWEGGTVVDGRRWVHVPWVGWMEVSRGVNGPAVTGASPFLPEPNRLVLGVIYRDPRTLRRRARLGRWLHQRRHAVVFLTSLAVVVGYAAVFVAFFDRGMPTMLSAAALVAAGLVLVAMLLAVVLWSRRD